MDIAREISNGIRTRRLNAILRRIYLNSSFYGPTLYNHVGLTALLGMVATYEIGGNSPIIHLAGLLHDIGAAMKGPEDHHKTGAEIAGKILKGIGYSEDIIKPVQYCILVHRGSREGERETIEAKCVASADGAAHFYQIPTLFSLAFLNLKLDSLSAGEWVKGKLERSWNKMLPVHQVLVREKYDVTMEVLGEALIW